MEMLLKGTLKEMRGVLGAINLKYEEEKDKKITMQGRICFP